MRQSDPTDLITSASELSSANDGMADFRFEEVAPRPLTTGDAFFNSEVRFSYYNNGSTRSMENMSYIRARLTLSKADGNDLVYDDMIAPAMNPLSTLFQKMEWIAGGTTITSVNEHVAQVSSLESRLLKSGSQLDKGENSSYLMSPYFEDRQDLVVRDVYNPDSRLLARGQSAQVANIDEGNDTLALDDAGTFTYVDAAGGDLDLTLYYKVGDYISFLAPSAVDTAGSQRIVARLTAVAQLVLTVGAGVIPFDMAANVGRNSEVDIRKLDRKQRSRTFEICWKPPIGVFSSSHPGTPAGSYELVAQPFPVQVAKLRFIQSLGLTTATLGDFNLNMDSIYLYMAKFSAPFVRTGTILLDLFESRLQTKTIIGDATSEQQQDFIIPPTTNAITLAFQDSRTQNDTRWPITQFKTQSDQELNLKSYYIQYAGQQRPHRLPNLQYDEDTDNASINQWVEQYYQTQEQNQQLFSQGSAETFEEWRDRGPYFFLDFPRSGEDRATVAQVYYTFNSPVTNTNVLLFSHARKVATLSIKDGMIENVAIDYV